MGNTRHRAEQRCPGCGCSQPLSMYESGPGRMPHVECSDCRPTARDKEPAPPRLLQHLRELGRGPMTEQEGAIVNAARVIAGRHWDMTGAGDRRAWAQRNGLHTALFAGGCHMLPGHYAEAARVTGGVIVDTAPGDAGALTARLIDLTHRTEYGTTAYLLIAEAWLPPEAVNEFERRAGRPIGVYPQQKQDQ